MTTDPRDIALGDYDLADEQFADDLAHRRRYLRELAAHPSCADPAHPGCEACCEGDEDE